MRCRVPGISVFNWFLTVYSCRAMVGRAVAGIAAATVLLRKAGRAVAPKRPIPVRRRKFLRWRLLLYGIVVWFVQEGKKYFDELIVGRYVFECYLPEVFYSCKMLLMIFWITVTIIGEAVTNTALILSHMEEMYFLPPGAAFCMAVFCCFISSVLKRRRTGI